MENNPCAQVIKDAAEKVGVKLTDKKVNKILSELTNYAQALAPRYGGDVMQAMSVVAEEAITAAKLKSIGRKRAKVLVLLREKEVENYVDRFLEAKLTAGEGMTAILEGSTKDVFGAKDSVASKVHNYSNDWSGEVGAKIEAIIPWHELRSGTYDLDIAKEMDALSPGSTDQPGYTGNTVASQVAAVLHNHEMMRSKLMNDAGAFRRPVKHFMGIQSHDAAKMQKLGMVNGKYDKEVAFKEWSRRMMERLDIVETFKGNPPMETLRAAWNNLETREHTNDAWDGIETYPTGTSLADRVSSVHRLFVFKDAESYVAHQKDFGSRDLADAVFNSIQNDARSLALLEKIGPGGKESLLKVLKRLRDKVQLREDSAKQMDSLKREESILGAWRIASGESDLPGRGWLANAQANLQNITVLSTQGATILSAAPDPAFQGLWGSRVGLGAIGVLMKDLAYFTSTGKSKGDIADKRALLKSFGVMPETYSRMSVGRIVTSDVKSRTLSKWVANLYDWNGMNKWTQDLKMASADALMVYLGEQVHLPFDQLTTPNQIMLRQYGITPEDWKAMEGGKQTVGGSTWLTGEGLEKSLQDKIRTLMLNEIDVAVPTPGARERRLLTFGGTQAGTFGGTVARLVGFLHSYGVTVNTKVLPNEVYGMGSKNWKEYLTGKRSWYRPIALAASSFVLGYAGLAAKEALSGRTPRPLEKEDGTPHWDNIREIAQRSGAAGLIGDLVLQEWQRGFKDPSTYASGVLMQKYVDPLLTIPWDFARGDERAVGKTISAIGGLVPFGNMLFARQAADYLFLSSVKEMLDHGSIRRAEDATQKWTGQKFFMRPSENHLKPTGY